MYAQCIKSKIHPATWAVIGVKQTALGTQIAHRGTAFAVDSIGHLLTCWHVTYADQNCQTECDSFFVAQPDLNQTMYQATLVKKEQNRDVALLKIDGAIRTKPVRLLGRTVPFGSSCCMFGH